MLSASDLSLVTFDKDVDARQPVLLQIQGVISKGDFEKFSNKLKKAEEINYQKGENSVSVLLNSPGGDLYESILIGRLIRSKNMQTMVHKSHSCSSACVIIFASGVFRVAGGKIGIHRPYISTADSNVSAASVKIAMDKMSTDVRQYFKELWVNESLADAMFSIAPENIRYLNEKELESFGLQFLDPVHQEQLRVEKLNKYGLTHSEFEVLYKLVELKCSNAKNEYLSFEVLKRMSECADSIYKKR